MHAFSTKFFFRSSVLWCLAFLVIHLESLALKIQKIFIANKIHIKLYVIYKMIWGDRLDSVMCDGTHKVLHLREHKVLTCSSSVVAIRHWLCVLRIQTQQCLVSAMILFSYRTLFDLLMERAYFSSLYSPDVKASESLCFSYIFHL